MTIIAYSGIPFYYLFQKGLNIMALDKNGKQLPKGITWIEKKQLYMGRFTYQGTPYTLYDKELKAIKKKLADKRYEVEHGLTGKADKLTLNKWFEVWLKDYKDNKVKKTTIQNYQTLYNNHIKDTLGKRILAQIKPIHIQKLYNDFIDSGYSTTSLQTLHALLHNILDIAVANDLLMKNPCMGTVRPTAERKERRVLSSEEQTYLLNFIRQEEWQFYEPVLTTMLGTGVRVGELLGLKWEDIDFENCTISINRTLVYIKNKTTGKFGFEEQAPKTKNSKRTIPLHNNVAKALKRQKLNQSYLKLHGKWQPHEGFEALVFTGSTGQPQQTASIQNILNRIVKAINKEEAEKAQSENRTPVVMEHLHPHALRHSFATRCFEADIPPKTVQMLLGHANIQITLDLYTHVSEEKKLRDMQKLDNLFANVV